MTCFLALFSDKKAESLTTELLQAHVNHLQSLSNRGVLRCCGPFANNQGAMQLLECSDRQTAEQLIKADPFIAAGYYKQFQLQEVIEANAANEWLLQDPQTRQNLIP
ncbi:YciI family protein [Shewanella sp. A32]|uniref:YciI family protein n=1 Tax=Shewanella sp. A32 TaxID=3031327 RepID=UPI0023B8C7B9|nr:YciI family protein [Shewanella sp. A32]MDF0533273.1 YciI family protein [Shewanella sp. A32]